MTTPTTVIEPVAPTPNTIITPVVTPPVEVISPPTTVVPPSTPSSEIVVPPVAAPVVPAPAVLPEIPVPAPVVEPEIHEYDIEVAENSPLSQAELDKIAEYASQNNLTKEAAQQLVAQQESLYTRASTSVQEIQNQNLQKKREALNSHPEFSGDKKEQSYANISRAVAAFGTPELINTLKSAEFGYDLNLAILLKNIGEALGPETVLPGAGVATGLQQREDSDRERLKRLYPNLDWDKK